MDNFNYADVLAKRLVEPMDGATTIVGFVYNPAIV